MASQWTRTVRTALVLILALFGATVTACAMIDTAGTDYGGEFADAAHDTDVIDDTGVAGNTRAAHEARVAYVIHISVDGLRPDAVTRQSAAALPTFYRLRREGAYTDNARTDVDYTITLPNHVSQVTGRPVAGPRGHEWTRNRDPRAGETLHSNRGTYVESVFDVLHRHDMDAAMYVSKSKFSLFEASYMARSSPGGRGGASEASPSGEDGPGQLDEEGLRIDRFVYEPDTEALVDSFAADMQRKPYPYVFIHLRDPDRTGHFFHWNVRAESAYMESVERVDGLLGRIVDIVETHPGMTGQTAIVLTSDHGGGTPWHHHSAADAAENYSIPFYVWGPDVCATELYAANPASRQHPDMQQPGYQVRPQPIRNGDVANLALSLLGLPAVPGSTINAEQDLRTCPPAPGGGRRGRTP